MIKVITYGTYDLLHRGHIRLLERAKALGDYLIVGVTADGFDQARGKINVQQPLMERIEAVKATGLADEIIVEEYEGQKIDDIKRHGVDIFTVGSDWQGKFDYLKEYCKVIYLDRTQGISSSELRSEQREVRLGLIGDSTFLNKVATESHYVNGINITGIFTSTKTPTIFSDEIKSLPLYTDNFQEFLEQTDAVYLISHPTQHYDQIKAALQQNKHVLCESPIVISHTQWVELMQLAKEHNCILMDAIRTAYTTAYYRLLLLAKSGRIGNIVSVDASCTSLRDIDIQNRDLKNTWNSICSWGPNALLPVFQLLGTQYTQKNIISRIINEDWKYDSFTKISFVYPNAVASIKVGKGVKTEGELIVSGTQGYIYVPAPWWKTEYFEIRYENQSNNKRYFYQLDGEGIRYELVSFLKAIETLQNYNYITPSESLAIVNIIEDFYQGKDFTSIK